MIKNEVDTINSNHIMFIKKNTYIYTHISLIQAILIYQLKFIFFLKKKNLN